MPFFSMLCGMCDRYNKVEASSLEEASSLFRHSSLCWTSLHPSPPDLFSVSSELKEINRFTYFHS